MRLPPRTRTRRLWPLVLALALSVVALLLFAIGNHVDLSLFPDTEDPMLDAIDEGDVVRIHELIAHGTDINFARDRNLPPTPLGEAAVNEDVDIVKLLLDAGARPVTLDNGKLGRTTPLIALAAHSGPSGPEDSADQTEIARLLLNAGVDVCARARVGSPAQPARTALELAQGNGADALAKQLVAPTSRCAPQSTP